MSDRATVLVALAAVLGAAAAQPVPRVLVWALVAGLVLGAVRAPATGLVAPLALGAAVALWATAGAATALGALRHGPVGTVYGPAQLVGDPVALDFGVRVDLRIDGRRVEAIADRTIGRALRGHLAGERVVVRGVYTPRPADAPWLDARHIAGRFRIDEVEAWRAAPWPHRVANAMRGLFARGAAPLAPDARSLYSGLVFGDDREQPALLADDFRAGGLGHLLAVSGQNVALTLAAVSPALRRVPLQARWPATLAVLALFVLVTRAEPSVLRAATMAAIATRASTLGRTASGIRSLGLAVTLLVCADPLLVRSVGFQLSVAASFGILVGSRPLAARLVGPPALREAVAVTLAAQLAVAPLSVWVFGAVPLASVPANLLAGPAAGAVMIWGLTAGSLAGLLGAPISSALHLPTRGLLWWITTVAGHAGRAPLGQLTARHVTALVAAAAVPWVAITLAHRFADPVVGRAAPALAAVRAGAGIVATIAVVGCIAGGRHPPPGTGEVAPDVWMWRAGAVVVELGSRPTAPAALRALREAGVVTIDVLVVRGTGSRASGVARQLRARYDPPVVWAPTRHQVRGAITPAPGTTLRAGHLEVHVVVSADRVGVAVRAV